MIASGATPRFCRRLHEISRSPDALLARRQRPVFAACAGTADCGFLSLTHFKIEADFRACYTARSNMIGARYDDISYRRLRFTG